MSYRARNIVLAGGLAVLAVVFMLVYAANARDDGNVGKQLVRVLVAGHTIDAGTPGSSLTGGAVVEKRIPEKAVVPDAITSPRQVRGLVATEPTLSGEQLTLRRFGPIQATGVLTKFAKRARAVQMAGDPSQVMDGTLKAGDHVDVMGAWTPDSCDKCRYASVIVRNALVLATSSELPSEGSGATQVPIQLRLNQSEANVLLWMQKNGTWWLALRPAVKPRSPAVERLNGDNISAYLKKQGLTK